MTYAWNILCTSRCGFQIGFFKSASGAWGLGRQVMRDFGLLPVLQSEVLFEKISLKKFCLRRKQTFKHEPSSFIYQTFIAYRMLHTGYAKVEKTLMSGFFLAENERETDFFKFWFRIMHHLYKHAYCTCNFN